MSKRVRRSKQKVEIDIMEATEELVKEVGFNNVTVTGLLQRANIEPNVFYKRYNNIDELLDKFVKQYDYWFANAVECGKDSLPQNEIKKLLVGLAKSFYKNDMMQQIILWELTKENNITKKTSANRELYSQSTLNYFAEELKNCDIDFSAATALIIAGIYYLVLHRNISTFCNIDFNSPKGKKALIKVIGNIIDRIYEQDKVNTIALNLLANNVDIDIIAKSTGLSVGAISKLQKSK